MISQLKNGDAIIKRELERRRHRVGGGPRTTSVETTLSKVTKRAEAAKVRSDGPDGLG